MYVSLNVVVESKAGTAIGERSGTAREVGDRGEHKPTGKDHSGDQCQIIAGHADT
jgi:hypothetical protein